MASIKSITFSHVGRNEGCTCDRCGQYLTNIWTVLFADGVRVNFGIDCFDKMAKTSNLNSYGEKQLKKAMDRIRRTQEAFDAEKALTEETDTRYQQTQRPAPSWGSEDAWYGSPWEEYHEWMLTKFWPTQLAEAQKEVARFRKVNFAR